MKRSRALSCFLLALLFAVSGCSAAPDGGSGKTLRIGVRGDIPDFG